MSLLSLHNPPLWMTSALLAAHLALGFGLGVVYFQLVWGSARRFVAGGSLVGSILIIVARFAVLAVVLAFASLEGAGPLLATALGFMIARWVVIRRRREAAP